MSRIGNYIDPLTGEEHWVEPETIENILLIPKRITKLGDNFETPIEYRITYNEAEKTVGIYAEYIYNNRSYRSTSVDFDVEEFANEIAMIVYANRTMDDSDLVKEAKEKTTALLVDRLFNEGVILSDFNSKGIGYVYANDDKKVIVFDEIECRSQGTGRYISLTMKNCVGAISLQNIDRPRITFCTNNHEISFEFIQVVESEEGRIRNYEIEISDLSIKPKTTVITLQDFADEDDLIQNRMSLLDSLVDEEDDLDDRFDDIL